MAVTIHKLKVYTKLSIIGLVILVVLIFLLQNSGRVSIRFLLWQTPEVPMFMFTLSAATSGVLVYRVSSRIGKVIREAKEIRRQDRIRSGSMEQTGKRTESKGLHGQGDH